MTVDPESGAPMADRMQSLLSQAVEDQRSEQRQLAVALTEVRGQLARITTDLEALRASGGGGAGGGSAEEAVATVSRDVREAVRMLAERLDAVGRSVQERGADLAEVKVAVQDLHSAVRGHTNALAGVNQALAAVPAVGERVGGLQDNLVSLHERLAGLEELTAAVDRLGQRIESADQDLRELRSAFAGMASRMAELPSRADLGAAGAQSSGPLDLIASRLARVESAIPELLSRVDAVREQLATRASEPEPGPGAAAASDGDGGSGAGLGGGRGGVDIAGRLDAVEAALVVLTEQLTAEPDDDLDEVGAEDVGDPVADQLAEMHEGLFGEDGLVARLEGSALDEDALDERIAEVVQAAVADSERRVSAHVDEAVLALAEAIFRTGRKAGRAAVPVAPVVPVVPVVPVPPAAAVTEEDEYDDAEEVDDDAEEYDETEVADEYDEAEDDEVDATPDEVDEEGEAEDARPTGETPTSAWQVPAANSPADSPADEAETEAKSGRRRPWWRPGD